MSLVLASASPRRADLLRAAGFDFEVRSAGADETVHPGELPEQYVRRVAEAKPPVPAPDEYAGTPGKPMTSTGIEGPAAFTLSPRSLFSARTRPLNVPTTKASPIWLSTSPTQSRRGASALRPTRWAAPWAALLFRSKFSKISSSISICPLA